MRVCGAMDNAPDYGLGDSRFDSWQARLICTDLRFKKDSRDHFVIAFMIGESLDSAVGSARVS